MNDPHAQRRDDDDRLITRLIDAEADDSEIEAFCVTASERPELIRQLLQTHRQSVHLAAAMERRLEGAGISAMRSLPEIAGRHALRPEHRERATSSRWTAWSGWAAAAVLCLLLLPPALSSPSPDATAPGTEQVAAPATSPDNMDSLEQQADEFLRSYLLADHVLGDLEPLLIETSTLPDGRIAVVYLRRIEEVAIFDLASVDPDRQPWVDEDGTLSSDPRVMLRKGV